jgi:hypothetical protein
MPKPTPEIGALFEEMIASMNDVGAARARIVADVLDKYDVSLADRRKIVQQIGLYIADHTNALLSYIHALHRTTAPSDDQC